MPYLRKHANLLNSIVFLYPTKESAVLGQNFGGTGFIVGKLIVDLNVMHVYCVTNWHVACKTGCANIRINRKDGGFDVFEHDPSEWYFLSPGPDVAVIPIRLSHDEHEATIVGFEETFFTEALSHQLDIGPGDDVFMAGRFIDYDGIEVNKPALRFGNISITDAEVRQDGRDGRSFVVDMHSRTGFSGSPVFVYRTPGSWFPKQDQIPLGSMLHLLGIHWGQFQESWQIKDVSQSRATTVGVSLVYNGAYVEGLSGMTCVCPAWDIRKVLEIPRLVELRAEAENYLRREIDRGSSR